MSIRSVARSSGWAASSSDRRSKSRLTASCEFAAARCPGARSPTSRCPAVPRSSWASSPGWPARRWWPRRTASPSSSTMRSASPTPRGWSRWARCSTPSVATARSSCSPAVRSDTKASVPPTTSNCPHRTASPHKLRRMEADYIVVGTGSAGAVLANRLSVDPAASVVVLEAGPEDKNRFIRIPAAFSKLFRSEVDWNYLTEPQKQLDGREIYWPRGKMLGGCSSMNAMMWVRGFAADYDEWGALAGEEWDFAHVSKYFAKIEAGPLVISPQRSPRSSTAAWLTAVRECGYDVENPNCDAPEGFCQTVVTQRRGARWSAADAYLKPALRRSNLTLQTEATATRVLFEGRRAVGVEYNQLGQRRVVRARREVVLSGGAVNSPQLLMLSGIGDREHLSSHGIDVVADVPEVGENMMDHLAVPLGFDVSDDTLMAA